MTQRLSRSQPAPPVGVVHLGLGAFFRTHQAWYTHAASGDPVGIAAFTGRRPDAAVDLSAQDGLYTLLIKDADGDRGEIIGSISVAHDGADVDALRRYLATPSVSVVTLTVTEAGYRRGAAGGVDHDDPAVAQDILAVVAGGGLATAVGRLVGGLDARRRADGGPIAVVPCDNLAGNGPVVRDVVLDFAAAADDTLRQWIDDNVSFVSTMVDRITPRTTDDDRMLAEKLTGYADDCPVVGEPFTEWVLTDAFPARRPAWETAGAQIVADVTPYEHRKLWLLNGGHCVLAYIGLQSGRETVAEAMADPHCRQALESWWDLAAAHFPPEVPDVPAYRAALTDRFDNPRIRHLLKQIASDGSQKLPERIAAVTRAERAAGRLPEVIVETLAGWLGYLRGGEVNDARAADLVPAVAGNQGPQVVVQTVAPDLADDVELIGAVQATAE